MPPTFAPLPSAFRIHLDSLRIPYAVAAYRAGAVIYRQADVCDSVLQVQVGVAGTGPTDAHQHLTRAGVRLRDLTQLRVVLPLGELERLHPSIEPRSTPSVQGRRPLSASEGPSVLPTAPQCCRSTADRPRQRSARRAEVAGSITVSGSRRPSSADRVRTSPE